MRIDCIHGYFRFFEYSVGEISRFISLFGLDIVKDKDQFTFDSLKEAPKYSLIGGTYLGGAVTKTYEGEPWDIMRENGLVYNFLTDQVVPILSITQKASVYVGSNYFVSQGLILPGSITDDGSRVTEYSARYLFDKSSFRYTEVKYG